MLEHLEHLPADFYLNAVRVLLEIWKVVEPKFKDKRTPERVEEIVIQAGKDPKPDTKQIEQKIAQDLDPADAAIVEKDLKLLTLVMIPRAPLDAFDYWGKLVQLVNGLQAFATQIQLFELRGMEHRLFAESLLLKRTSEVLMPKHVAESSCVFNVQPGQQRHWLRFCRVPSNFRFRDNYEYRLDAEELISIVDAMRDDIAELAKEVQADATKIGPLFKQIDEFTRELPEKDVGTASGE